MAKVSSVYVCSECGNEYPEWIGKCSACEAWNTVKEVRIAPIAVGKGEGQHGWVRSSELVTIDQASTKTSPSNQRTPTMEEVDRVLGGGLVPGSAILLAGEPGVGKSTLLLQLAAAVGKISPVRYISGEESVDQVRNRA